MSYADVWNFSVEKIDEGESLRSDKPEYLHTYY